MSDNCVKRWKYADGEKWNDDPTIYLQCNTFSKAPFYFPSKQNEEKVSGKTVKIPLDERLSLVELNQLPLKMQDVNAPCKKFILDSNGKAKAYQESRLGTYRLQKDTVNGRIFYFNEKMGQYLSWIDKYDRYWMVRINNCIWG